MVDVVVALEVVGNELLAEGEVDDRDGAPLLCSARPLPIPAPKATAMMMTTARTTIAQKALLLSPPIRCLGVSVSRTSFSRLWGSSYLVACWAGMMGGSFWFDSRSE